MAHEIPVIDIAPFLAGGDGAEAAARIERAAVEVGFFQVIGHGVPTDLLDAAYAAMYELSSLDVGVKERFRSPVGHPYRGLHLRRDRSGTIRQERFLATRFDDPAAAVAAGIDPALADYFAPNTWPDQPAGFRAACENLFAATQRLAGSLMRLAALALDIGPNGFDGCIEPNSSTFAINHYPSSHAPIEDGPDLLFHEHADGNTLTLLHQRGDFEGLQVQRLDADGEWISVPVREDAFVINLGKLMTRWTNGHWPATMHRVVTPADPALQRTTLTTFHMPPLATVIAPLPRWCDADGPRFEPITTYESERSSIRNYALPRTDGLILDPTVVQFASSER